MKFKHLHEKGKLLDKIIDDYLKKKRAKFVPIANLEKMVPLIFPGAHIASYGMHKLVFKLQHKSHQLALKIGKEQAIEHDHKAYKQLPSNMRRVYFARVFWHTKYCLLQEYGVETEVTKEQLSMLRSIAGKYGLLDISCENIRNINGNLKIIDAGVAPPGLFRLWKTADFVTLRLPSPVRRVLRKSRLVNTVKGR